MRRRTFLRLAAASTAVGGVGTLSAAAPSRPPTRGGPNAVRVASSELDEVTLRELQEGMARGQWSSVTLVRQYLERIERVDRDGPGLRSVLAINPDASSSAAELDKERKARGPRGALHGIPILIKDNIETRDRMPTTAGSLALARSFARQDAFLVERLRAAGAVVLGKTNLSEWANFRGERSTSGWSAVGGQTCNPYSLERNPSGSSSGSAVAVAAGLCAVAVGTETDGSILSPSSYNGIVGIKPTVGLVSRSGIIPIAHSQDTAGPIARTVTDAAMLLEVMAGGDRADRATLDIPEEAAGDYTTAVTSGGLRDARLGVVRELFGPLKAAERLIEEALAAMKGEGAVLIDPVRLGSRSELGRAEYEVLLFEYKTDLNAYLGGLGAGAEARSLAELIEFNERHRAEELVWFGQEHMVKAEAKGPLTEPAYLEALATCRRLARTEGIDALMEEHGLDALIAPTTGPAHVTDYVHGDRGTGGSTSLAAVAGYPSVTVPAGQVHGLPVGLSFFGRAWSERKLLGLAYGFEQLVGARRKPHYRLNV